MTSSCIDDDSSAWLSSYGDANRYDFLTTRPIKMDGFVHTAQGFADNCVTTGTCSGAFTDTAGVRAMGYYDQDMLNYYYYMAAQFTVNDRWFSPIASKSTPNRIATYTGGTTQGLVWDPGYNDHLGGVPAASIFEALDKAGVSWKVYYSLTQGQCDDPEDCTGGSASYPATDLGYIYYDTKYLYPNPSHAVCKAPTVASSAVGDTTNYFCIDPTHVGPLADYYSDLANGTMASFSFIEAGYGLNDEHPGSFQPVLLGQAAVAKIINAFMASSSWKDGVFFFAYDEGGGPYDHVPPIPHHSNDFTDKSLGTIPDIGPITVNPDQYGPCLPPVVGTPTQHCDLHASDPGAHAGDAPAVNGFAAQIGFRVPDFVVSPFARRHYVSHIPMDHTAVMKFVENRFIGPTAHLTARDAAQPNLLDFFDFVNVPWATPPTPPTPATDSSLGYHTCNPASLGN
jgi:phospholipase C